MRVLCIGHAAYDITVPMEAYPVENTKYRVNNTIECGGGPASNAAYLLGKWGIETYFAGVVGNDDYGKKIKKEFKDIGVDTTYLELDSKSRTTLSFIINNQKNGTRTVFTNKFKNKELSKNIELTPDIILMDGEELNFSKKILKSNPDAISIMDAGRVNDNVVELAKLSDYVVCSKVFAEEYTNIRINIQDSDSMKSVFKKLFKDFKNVVITLEEKGAIYQKDNKIKLMPSMKVKQLDSTGAGDIFHGAFVYGILNAFDIEKIIMMSNIAGALSVTKVGGRNSMPSLKEVKEVYNKCSKE